MDLAKSKRRIGPLYPILVDADGYVIDGIHRTKIEGWPIVRLKWIKGPHERILGRIKAHHDRRVVDAEEKRNWVEQLASLHPNLRGRKLIEHLTEETGLSDVWFYERLGPEYKERVHKPKEPKTEPRGGGGPKQTSRRVAPEYMVACPSCGTELKADRKVILTLPR